MGGVKKLAKQPLPGLVKWWGKHTHVNGMVTEHISPYRQHIISPIFRDFGKKTAKRFTDNWFTAGVPFVGIASVGVWAQWQYDQNCRSHWP
mmetsp:Transcript_7202/g.11014  ORF Transcript_7202/g.11014 Transcript_7202/m.11014 type:complete len:91 (-) Transcript_7202:119-391(-)